MIIQAAVRGGFDFNNASLRDPKWWRKLNLHLDQIEADNYNHLSYLRALQHLSIINPQIPFESMKKHWDASNEFIGDIYRRLCPWEQYKNKDKSATDLWIRAFGDPNDPEVKKRIDNTVAYLEGMAKKSDESEEYRILRRKPGVSKWQRR